jgi:hypothetical protein
MEAQNDRDKAAEEISNRPSPYRDVRREGVEERSMEARRAASVVMEVLAGGLSPAEAGAALGISPPQYYKLEERAVRGLVAACEPMQLGPLPRPEKKIQELEKRCTDLEREVARYQALARASQRGLGLDTGPARKGRTGGTGKRGRPRKPAVRALKIAGMLKQSRSGDKEAPPVKAERAEAHNTRP